MYILSKELSERIAEISQEVEAQSDHILIYEEFIALPCYGQIMLRFTLDVRTGYKVHIKFKISLKQFLGQE